MSSGPDDRFWPASVARVVDGDCRTTGTAFAIAPDLMITCAHVVPDAARDPDGNIHLIFPELPGEPNVVGQVITDFRWDDPLAGDLALVQLAEAPGGLNPLPLDVSARNGVTHRVQSFGFPDDSPTSGRAGSGQVAMVRPDHAVASRLQLAAANSIAAGFSGAPVLDMENGLVIGMVTGLGWAEDPHRNTETAYATPVDHIREVCPGLAAPARHDRIRVRPEPDKPGAAALKKAVKKDCDLRQRHRTEVTGRSFNLRWAPETGEDPGKQSLAEYYFRLQHSVGGAGYKTKLVVLGPAGSGKTDFAVKFVADYLDFWSTWTGCVPVFLSVGSWEAVNDSFEEWLAGRLRLNFGVASAETLLADSMILPVLDGFDEVSATQREQVIDQLNGYGGPLVLTSRPGVYGENGVLDDAEVIELASLTVDDLDAWLRLRSAQWTPVIDRMRAAADSEEPGQDAAAERLAEVLSTPLMAWLAGREYRKGRGSDPMALLRAEGFQSAKEIEDFLLRSFARTVYDRGTTGDDSASGPGGAHAKWAGTRAADWAGYIARYLQYDARRASDEKSQDLEWWRLGEMLRPWPRVLSVMVVVGVVVAIVDAVVEAFMPLEEGKLLVGLGGVVDGPLTGLLFGLLFGAVYAIRDRFGQGKPRVEATQLLPLKDLFDGILGKLGDSTHWRRGYAGFLAGLAGGVIYGIGYGLLVKLIYDYPHGPPLNTIYAAAIDLAVFGPVFGLAAGAGFWFMSLREEPIRDGRLITPLGLLESNRKTVLGQLPVLVVAMTLTIIGLSFAAGQVPGVNMGWVFVLDIGLVVGIAGPLVYILVFTAWGQWLIMARVVLPLLGRLPRNLIEFLEDSCELGVLRQSGVAYQFRHASLQEILSPSDSPADVGARSA